MNNIADFANAWRRVGLILVVGLCTSYSHAGEAIIDPDHGFTLTLPDGFTPSAELKGAAPNILHAFVLGDTSDDELDIILLVERMRGTIGRESLKPEELPPGFRGRLFQVSWQDFEVDAFEVPEELGDLKVITYNVQIPLRKVAIQIKLMGAADREQELRSLLDQILSGLKGESNWDTADGASALSSSYRSFLLGAAISLVLGGLLLLFWISKIAPSGTVLAIAAVLYFASWGFEAVPTREAQALGAGGLRMLGFAGGLLGLWELFRTRRKARRSAGTAQSEGV